MRVSELFYYYSVMTVNQFTWQWYCIWLFSVWISQFWVCLERLFLFGEKFVSFISIDSPPTPLSVVDRILIDSSYHHYKEFCIILNWFRGCHTLRKVDLAFPQHHLIIRYYSFIGYSFGISILVIDFIVDIY